jgi:DNA processing protein
MPRIMTRTEAYLALNLLPKVGGVRVRRLLQVFGTPQRILSATAAELKAVEGIGPELAQTISKWEDNIDLLRELRRIDDLELTLIDPDDDLYPANLREIHSPPLVLYVWGQLTAKDATAIGVVGSRQATLYGMNQAKRMSFQLAYAGYTVISGLARGIDTAAHEAALAAKGRTIAVIGSGMGKLYPPENQSLAERIAQSGAVITEFPVDYPPDKQSFPLRNRIVAGWSTGLLVVEAPVRSGSLITAGQATEAGRTVYAVPGPVDKPTSMGCNRLIQQGAKLVVDGADIIDDLNVLFPTAPQAPDLFESAPAVQLSGDEATVYAAVGKEETAVDVIIDRAALAPPQVSAALMRLEMKRLVRPLPGQRYVRMI